MSRRYSLKEMEERYKCDVVDLLMEIRDLLKEQNTASTPNPEEVLEEHHHAGPWYEINGKKVQGKDAALNKLKEEGII